MKNLFYVTTPIYYVNDVPHVGHAYTTIAADVLTRFHSACGREVFFLTGTDEHGQKVDQAARKRGISPQTHCDELVVPFQELWKKLNISNSKFLRTTNANHRKVVEKALTFIYNKGLIEKRKYEGWYSTSSERFWMEKDLVDGKDPDTGLPVEWISEANYFFLMSQFKDQLINHLKQNPEFIRPKSRYNEILGFLSRDLDDLCISRPKNRLGWGIELPFDTEYVTYVWFDALLNYLSGVGYLQDNQELMKFWPASFHLIGKDILTTHSVYWITMLMALEMPLPRHIFAHGWWTVEGRKMSKSLRNVIDPNMLINTYGPDQVRYFLLREVPFGQDGDFSHSALIGRINADLANDLGNALNRSIAMAMQNFDGKVPEPSGIDDEIDEKLKLKAAELFSLIAPNLGETLYSSSEEIGNLNFSIALEQIWSFIRFINKYIDTQAPWKLAREGNSRKLANVVYNCLEALRISAVFCAPFMPQKAVQLLHTIGIEPTFETPQTRTPLELMFNTVGKWGALPSGTKLNKGEVLFPRIEPEHVQEVLKMILSLTENENQALELFRSIFPKIKKGKALDWVAKLLGREKVNLKYEKNVTQTHKKSKKKKQKGFPEPDEEITFDTFAKTNLRIAEVISAERVPNSDKLIKLMVNLGQYDRQIVAGIGKTYSPEELVGKKIVVVANLKPTKLMGIESQGMLLAAGDSDTNVHVCQVSSDTENGLRVH